MAVAGSNASDGLRPRTALNGGQAPPALGCCGSNSFSPGGRRREPREIRNSETALIERSPALGHLEIAKLLLAHRRRREPRKEKMG